MTKLLFFILLGWVSLARSKGVIESCPTNNKNIQGKKTPFVTKDNVTSWEECAKLARGDAKWNFWVWHHSSPKPKHFKFQCYLVEDFTGDIVDDKNTIIGDRNCNAEGAKVIYSDDYDSRFPGSNVLVEGCDKRPEGCFKRSGSAGGKATNYWLAKSGAYGEQAKLIIDFGEALKFASVHITNTHNGECNDRSTKEFRLWASMTNKDDWENIVDGELEDASNKGCDVPQKQIQLNSTEARYIKFTVESAYGKGGGLQSMSFKLAEADAHP